MRTIRLIVVPYEVGRLRDGVGRGPEHLLDAGAEDALRSAGAEVSRVTLELTEKPSDEIDASFELIRLTAREVAAAVAAGEFPVVLSGSCAYPGVGVVAGLGEAAPAVVWFDAHGDFNDPETGDSGYFDGMGVSVLTGSAWQGMLATVEGAAPIPETSVLHVGGRDFDDPEVVRIEASELNLLAVNGLRGGGLPEALASMRPEPSGVYLHLDLDVLDGDELPVNVYSAPDGLSPEELESAVASILQTQPVRALSLTAYDPEVDVGNAVPPIALRLLKALAEHVESATDSSPR
jgi:arginase